MIVWCRRGGENGERYWVSRYSRAGNLSNCTPTNSKKAQLQWLMSLPSPDWLLHLGNSVTVCLNVLGKTFAALTLHFTAWDKQTRHIGLAEEVMSFFPSSCLWVSWSLIPLMFYSLINSTVCSHHISMNNTSEFILSVTTAHRLPCIQSHGAARLRGDPRPALRDSPTQEKKLKWWPLHHRSSFVSNHFTRVWPRLDDFFSDPSQTWRMRTASSTVQSSYCVRLKQQRTMSTASQNTKAPWQCVCNVTLCDELTS